MPRSRCRIGSGSGSMSAGPAWSMPSPEARARPRDRPRLGADPPGRDRATAGPTFRLSGVGITISQLSGPTEDPAADGKNAVTMATGELPLDRPCRHQSILGNIHTGRLVDKTMLAGRPPCCRKSPASAGSVGWTRWSWITAIRSRGLHRGRHLGVRQPLQGRRLRRLGRAGRRPCHQHRTARDDTPPASRSRTRVRDESLFCAAPALC